jgi:hypothetical protein
MLPHRGHLYLVREAAARCDDLIVLVYSIRSEPIPEDYRVVDAIRLGVGDCGPVAVLSGMYQRHQQELVQTAIGHCGSELAEPPLRHDRRRVRRAPPGLAAGGGLLVTQIVTIDAGARPDLGQSGRLADGRSEQPHTGSS